MLVLLCIAVLVLQCTGFPSVNRDPPVFPDNYVVKGILLLPYAEIKEPFTAYYDAQNGNSRIDYYGDIVQTVQKATEGDHGVSYKIAYMPDEAGKPIHTCFIVNGSVDNPVKVQSILPNVTSFSYIKATSCYDEYSVINGERNERVCELWTLRNEEGDKINTYNLYVDKDTFEPVHYVMKGYNTLLGSHYDKYELYYTEFVKGNATADDFDITPRSECRSFPGPGVEVMVLNNPIQEFVNNDESHIHKSFEEFKTEHGKTYPNRHIHESRKNIYRQNYRYVSSMNRAGLSYGLKLNHLADYSDFEMHRIRGRLPTMGFNGGMPFPIQEFPSTTPDNFDWRIYGAVTPVKDQAICGSCWSFGTTGTIEGAYFLKTEKLVRLSQQQLIDCSWRYQNNGCDGGEDFRAYAYIMDAGGLASEDDYGQYIGEDGICHAQNVTKTAEITGFVNVTSGDLDALRKAIVKKGPISVSIDASRKGFSFYSHGVYYDPECKKGENQLDHSVLAVGYGVMNDQPFWIIKNSWSTYWGNDGYVLISQKDNNCGVATSPTYVIM